MDLTTDKLLIEIIKIKTEKEKEEQRKLLKEIFDAVIRDIRGEIDSWEEVGISTFPRILEEKLTKMFVKVVRGAFHSVMGPKGLGCIEE